ncbi:hypothetical protein [Burkholderia pseudomallei]|uniref:hypothetical protein n=1 Tax=Burkholderia pseudomallei TaxID=28450 RepID=UPI0021F78435|nr:hypothetical protein [Burkholderia pseudomallei]MCV9985501.1 hypothetical protein [Burkholderia pseudomallei]MCV9991735.1 hypothetical protein [Burkholderia pseudomallei]
MSAYDSGKTIADVQKSATQRIRISHRWYNRKFTKQKSTGRIDGMVALAMAVGVTQQNATESEIEPQMFFI